MEIVTFAEIQKVKSSFEFKNSISSTRNCNEFRFFEPRFTSLKGREEGGGEGVGAPFNVLPPGATDLVVPLHCNVVQFQLTVIVSIFLSSTSSPSYGESSTANQRYLTRFCNNNSIIDPVAISILAVANVVHQSRSIGVSFCICRQLLITGNIATNLAHHCI